MGGFVFDNSRNSDSPPFPGEKEQVAINQKSLVWLAKNEPDMIPDISPGHITDKSKANHLAKLLVCIQAGWFGLQVVTRLCQGLAVTLLELNVLAHVVCTLLTYAFWWKKPLDIDEPTSIYTDDPKAGSICAAFWSRVDLQFKTVLVVRKGGQSTTEPMMTLQGNTVGVDQMVLSPQRAQELWGHCFDGSTVASQRGSRHFPNHKYHSEDVSLRMKKSSCTSASIKDMIFIELDSALVNAELERSMIELRTVVSGPDDRFYVGFKDYNLQRHLCAHSHPAGLRVLMPDSPAITLNTKQSRISNWSNQFDSDTSNTNYCLFTATSVFYSAWHLTAWNGPFRTAAEGILWKVSAVSVAGVPIVAFAGFVLGLRLPIEALVSDWLVNFKLCADFAFLLPGCCLVIFSRTFLVVESFISLAFVPDTVFSVPQWSVYFPHLG